MTERKVVRLGSVAKLLSGGTPAKDQPKYWNGSIPWLTPKDMAAYDATTEDHVTPAAIGNGTRLAPAEAIFITVRGMSLHKEIRVARSDREMAFNQDIKAITPTGIDGRFLYYAIVARKPELLGAVEAAGHGTGRLPTDRLEALPVPTFPEREQQAIASILGALDDKIDLNRRMNETLEAMARALFKDWFVDFGPTRAKMEGRPPYLTSDLWALFPDRLDGEGKPEGWSPTTLGDVADLNPRERLRVGCVAPYLDMAAIPTQGMWPSAPTSRPAGSGARFRNGDTLLARITPCLENGKTAYVGRLGDDEVAWGSTEFIVIRPRPPFPSEFGYLLARDPNFREHAIRSMTGTSGRQRVQPDALENYPVTRPTDTLLQNLAEAVRPCFQKIASNEAEAETLAATRDLLLPKLMSGEIRVRDAEKMVEPAL
ncbi:restriction endonuclease subunit S [Acidiphilium sp. JA12-A1]|uniref:restriction endonuclease subunit S n=1 Tax=Acidiphilium sp. JA12-A1 TaxID=1464546 RepID=UPI000460C8AD|nr:restriction endonuclease subunit S [Acidiphilium sp. JA12-A1]KDM67730.1 putative type-1 restriction enzyme MjaXP specificity protein [Acidiphilium sp. JA12-A1]